MILDEALIGGCRMSYFSGCSVHSFITFDTLWVDIIVIDLFLWMALV
jgi:hypothetical protein